MDNATTNKNVWIEQPVPSQTKRTYYYDNGTYLTKEGGTVAWRNNNEGNLRPGSLSSNRIGVDKKNFAVFATPEDGHAAKKYLLFSSSKYKDLTLKQAIAKYAPASDNNNPTQYANYIMTSGNIGEKVMSAYSADEQNKIMSAMKVQEGYKIGTETWGTHTNSKPNKTVAVDNKNVTTGLGYNQSSAIKYNKNLSYSTNKWKSIQDKLNNVSPENKLNPDGIPGGLTADAVYRVQAANNMEKKDGKLGPKTAEILNI